MSRNVRQKHPTTPVKVSKRRASVSSSSLDLSDDGGYSGLENLDDDDDDDDEEDVDAAEEEHILSDELHQAVPSSPRPQEDSDDDLGDDEDDGDDDVDLEDEEDDDNSDAVLDSDSWNGIESDQEADAGALLSQQEDAAVQRRVRFDVPDSSDGDSTETDDEIGNGYGFFPDLFVEKASLDPSFRREIDYSNIPDDDSSSDAFWDHYSGPAGTEPVLQDDMTSDFEVLMKMMEEEESTPVATPMTHNDLSTALSTPAASPEKDDASLDGYQTDGDTTDEEDPPEKPIRRKTRKEVAGEEDSDSEGVTLIKPRRGQPRVGRFTLDKSHKKPIAILNPRTGKMMIFTHQSKQRFDLSPEQFNFSFFNQHESSPMLSNPGNIMMSGMISSNTFGDFMNTHTVGPAEAWYAHTPGCSAIEESESDEHDVDEDERNLKLEDFLVSDNNSDSSDDENLANNDDNDDIFRTPGRPTTSGSDVTSLLDHFEQNSNIVGAFRRDQANHQLISRSKATHDSLAFSGPYFEGTLRGIKDGRIATTNVPISPLRKKKIVPDLASSPLSSMGQKRKSSSEQHMGHKRQRSIPDVQPLTIG
ncbi:hypothetical protein F5Y15DRAFT_399855 [Xylariaceae sp. FL0016]|nr:hypothetical protein F5Y15DRAFT_399855 [Xylariaceae sp. FL0016]